MSHVIVRHVKSLPVSPGPYTCVHVAHTMRCLNIGREGEVCLPYPILISMLFSPRDSQFICAVQ